MASRLTTQDHSGFTLVEVMTALAILSILAAIAMTTFQRLQSRAHQAETIGNLSRVFTGEVTLFAEYGRYGSFTEIGFNTHGISKRYTYRSPAVGGAAGSSGTADIDLLVAQGGVLSPDNTVAPSDAALPAGPAPPRFTATATGNLDTDATIDQWHVNDIKDGLANPDIDDSAD
jgi:prepilin-type N-terminal cleavage/methylation domain-containing protein